MPIVSKASNLFYTIGARNEKWTVEALNWTTGELSSYYIVGDQKYNPLFSGVLLDADGDIMYGTIFGRVRIKLDK